MAISSISVVDYGIEDIDSKKILNPQRESFHIVLNYSGTLDGSFDGQ